MTDVEAGRLDVKPLVPTESSGGVSDAVDSDRTVTDVPFKPGHFLRLDGVVLRRAECQESGHLRHRGRGLVPVDGVRFLRRISEVGIGARYGGHRHDLGSCPGP